MEKLDINQIRKQILEKYSLRFKDKIHYAMLHTIYLEYENLYDEKTFALEVLEISYGCYCNIKYNPSKRATILRNEIIDIKKLREEIIQRYFLKPGDKINYSLLQRIAQDYKHILSERTIAFEILEIGKASLYPIKKNPEWSTTILNSQLKDEIGEIGSQILKNENLYPGDMIDYSKLKNIASKYNVNEKVLAIQIFGIKKHNYDNIRKEEKRRTAILPELAKKRSIKNSKVKYIDDIREKIIKEHHLIVGEKIDYKRLHEIYIKSGINISEKEFAIKILGLVDYRYFNLKAHENEKAVILKNEIEARTYAVREKIKDEEDLYPGDRIDYERLKIIIEKYKEYIEEKILLREVLGLDAMVVRGMKANPNRQTIIMKDFIEIINEEEITSIRDELLENGKIKPGQKIDYEEFSKLYNQYKERVNERTFATNVLQVNAHSFAYIKRKKDKKIIICKDLIEKYSQEQLINEVYGEYGLHEGQKINYQQLVEMASKYKDLISQKEFAVKVVGIPEKNYWHIKYNPNSVTYILNPFIKEKADKIRYVVSRDKRYYGIEEIEKICKEQKITKEQFCHYVLERTMHTKGYFDSDLYMRVLQKKGYVFIGRGEPVTKEFARRHQQIIIDFSKSLAIKYCRKYQATRHIEDYAEDTMLYIIENCGDLERNFEEGAENWWKVLIYARARAFIIGKILHNKKINRNYSIETFYNRKGEKEELVIKDEDDEQREKDKINYDFSDKPELIRKVLELIGQGYNPQIAIKIVAEKDEIEEAELLEEIKDYYKSQQGEER